jgi:1-acyl-sn-glycerol-3-phosphate acyltransferase
MNLRKRTSETLFRTTGWTLAGADLVEGNRRCVVTAAPHTSNWDLLYSLAAFDLLELPVRFTIKQEWMRWPWNLALGPLGGISIDRSPQPAGDGAVRRPSMVDAMVRIFDTHPGDIAIMVTPEGTRSRRDEWKTGFWHVAKRANVPILLGYLDYAKKCAGIGRVIVPTDFDTDMRDMMAFYADVTPAHPELFALDKRFAPGAPPRPAESHAQD